MKIPWIKEPVGKIRVIGGQRFNSARQYKKWYCKTYGITGKQYRKRQKLQRRLQNALAERERNIANIINEV